MLLCSHCAAVVVVSSLLGSQVNGATGRISLHSGTDAACVPTSVDRSRVVPRTTGPELGSLPAALLARAQGPIPHGHVHTHTVADKPVDGKKLTVNTPMRVLQRLS